MSEVNQVLNPIVRYQLCDRDKQEFLTDVGCPMDIFEQIFTKEEIETININYPNISMEDAIEISTTEKNVIFAPIHEIENSIHGSSSNLYNFSTNEITLSSPTNVNVLNISPLHINEQLITHIEFIRNDNIIIHKYFYNTGHKFESRGLDQSIPDWYNLVVKEKFIPEDKGHIQYDKIDQILKIILDRKEYKVIYSMDGIRILDEGVEILTINSRVSNDHIYKHLKSFLKSKIDSDIKPDPQITNIPLICLDNLNDISSNDIYSAIEGYITNRNKLCTFSSRYISNNTGFASLENNKIICDINSYHFNKNYSDEDNMITITLNDANKLDFDITKYSAYFKLKNINDSTKGIEAIFLLENN